MPTFFFRNREFKSAPGLEASRIIAALLHLGIPFVTYNLLWNNANGFGGWYNFLPALTNAGDVIHPDRKLFLMILDIYYSVRWAVGVMIMQSRLTIPIGIFVSFKHLLLDEMGYILGSIYASSLIKIGDNSLSSPSYWWFVAGRSADILAGPLTYWDLFCGVLMVLAGILQHGSELQRWFFKRNVANQGRIHTVGLFSVARGINHTGHILRDLAHVMLVPNYVPLVLFYVVADYDLSCTVVPETQRHMKQKYGERWEKYEKKTPWLFVPGIY